MPPIFEFNEFRLETAERRLLRGGIDVPLAPKVFDTLVVLVENPGRLMSKEELMQRLWPNTFVEEASLAQNISQLRKAFGEAPGDSQIIQTVAKRGYRFVAPVRIVEVAQPSNGTSVNHPSAGDRSEVETNRAPVSGNKRKTWTFVAGSAVAIVLVAAGYFALSGNLRAGVSKPAIHSLAVLPLANLSTDPEQEFFADGMTDDLITELARIRAIRVISRTSVMQYKGTRKSLPEIARELNVDALVEGTVSQHGELLHITAQLVQANPEQHIWAETYERPLADAQNLQSEIAREIAGAVRATMTPEEQARMRRSRPANAEANLLYLKGRYFWNKRTPEGVREGERYFQQAIAKDGDFAQAYVGLADAYIFEGGWGMEPATVILPRAEVVARQAIAFDPENAEAHAALGLIAMNYEWDWPKAEKEFKLALSLNPNDATAHHWYSEYLGAQGRSEEALAELDRAQQLDPLSVVIGADRGKLLYFARQYDAAIEQLQKTLKMDPGFLNCYGWLLHIYAQKGMEAELSATLERMRLAAGNGPGYWGELGIIMARARRQRELRDALTKAQGAAPSPDPATMLQVRIATGDKDGALDWMEKCYAMHSTVMTSLKVNPDYDPLRGDPRFAKYLERVRLSN